MHNTDDALVLRNGPVLAPVWVQEDEYSYHLHINLACNHGMSLTVWKGVNAHHPPERDPRARVRGTFTRSGWKSTGGGGHDA
jgi:hypothetical protein